MNFRHGCGVNFADMRVYRMLCLLTVVLAFLAVSCNKPQEESYCRFLDEGGSPVENITFRKSGGDRTYRVESGGEWNIVLSSGADSWISVTPSEGGDGVSVQVSASPNDGVSREAFLSLRCGASVLDIPVFQMGGEAYLKVSPSVLSSSEPGEEFIVNVDTNLPDWEVSAEDADWYEIKEKTDDRLVVRLTGPVDMLKDRHAEFRFFSKEFSDLRREKVRLTYRRGLLLDAAFQADGSAKDLSSYGRGIVPQAGSSMVTYYNGSCARWMARFNNSPGETVSTGFYKVEYMNDPDFKAALADGHSIEAVFMLEAENDGNYELKMFSSHASGGTGLMVSGKDRGQCITFLPNVSSSYVWAGSGVVPERGRYYHAVGVWDKKNGQARIYVDGELKASVPAPGEFCQVSGGAPVQWFGIGADAGASGEAAWKGDVAVARIYDVALDDGQVRELWKKADNGVKSETVHIDDIMFLSGCQLAPGSDYIILGRGYADGDSVLWEKIDGTFKAESSGRATEKSFIATVPDGISDGKYKIFLKRGGSLYPLGVTDLVVTSSPVALKAPKVIAHRCFHKNGNTENSLAALRAAQELGVYGAEIDIYITSDDRIMVHHDGVIAGKRIEQCTYDQVRNLKLANGENLPLFTDMLEIIKSKPGMKLIIEIKDHLSVAREQKAVDEAIRLVRQYGLESQVEYIAFDYELCKRIVRAVPDAMVCYLSGDREPEEVYADGVMSIDYSFNALMSRPEWVARARDLGMTVNVWTVNSDADLMRSIAMGVDYITTDNPDRLKEISERFF